MTKVTIEYKKNHEHIIGEEYKESFGEFEEASAKQAMQDIANEYEASLNSDGFEMDDQDDINNVEAITNLQAGEYDFNVGDFTYFIEIQ